MKEFKCLVDGATAKEIFKLPSSEFERHIKIRTIANDGTLTMRFLDNEQPKPRTKTEYVKVHKSNTTPFEFCQMILDGIKFYDGEHCGGHYDDINAINRYGRGSQSLYRKVEKEIDWREYLTRDYALWAKDGRIGMKQESFSDSGFIAMCRLVESLTRHIEVE